VHATRTQRHPGFVLGEGAAVILVEDETAARSRGARIDARVAGIASHGAPVSPHARRGDPAILAAAMRDALDQAGLTPACIGLVHLSRNGSPFTDSAESAALADLFGAKLPRLMAVKESLGENPAIGAIQLALAAAELRANPEVGAILIDAFGAGGNVLAAVLTAP